MQLFVVSSDQLDIFSLKVSKSRFFNNCFENGQFHWPSLTRFFQATHLFFIFIHWVSCWMTRLRLTRLPTRKTLFHLFFCFAPGSLLDDATLVDVLADSKITSVQVGEQLVIAEETNIMIDAARELYRSAFETKYIDRLIGWLVG